MDQAPSGTPESLIQATTYSSDAWLKMPSNSRTKPSWEPTAAHTPLADATDTTCGSLADLLRENQIIGANELAPGENHRYLTEFGGAAVYAHEHPPLDRRLIANEIPQAVDQMRAMVDAARESWCGYGGK